MVKEKKKKKNKIKKEITLSFHAPVIELQEKAQILLPKEFASLLKNRNLSFELTFGS